MILMTNNQRRLMKMKKKRQNLNILDFLSEQINCQMSHVNESPKKGGSNNIGLYSKI